MYNLHTLKTMQNRVTELLRKEPSVEGVLIVGSGATGFSDDFSDLDLVVVVNPKEKTREVFEDLLKKMRLSFDIYRVDLNEFGEDNFLAVFLLTDFMEIDLGVLSLDALTAKKENWKVLFDKSDLILKKMQDTWHARKVTDAKKAVEVSINVLWYHIKNAAFALKRNQSFRALKEMEEIRNEAVQLWAVYEDKVAKHFRDVDRMRSDFRRKLAETYQGGVELENLVKTFHHTFELYFWVIKELDGQNEQVLEFEKRMRLLVREVKIDELTS